MKAVVRAAGYATRLRPLTDSIAKPLLPLAGRPMVDYLCDRIDEVGEIERIHVVTNARFASQFAEWAAGRSGRIPVAVHDDGTSTNEDRLGAIGDLRFVVEQAGLAGEHLFVVAGDNLFEFSPADYVAFWRAKGRASAIAVHDVGDLELVRQYGVVTVGEGDRVVSVVEKPERPESTLAATAAYLFHADHAALTEQYLAEGNSPDQPGRFVVWLHEREPVYAWRFPGSWLDIGDRHQLLQADNELRRQGGLPLRDEYSLS
jgi:glucose-1-phosphate thymidylyltransferase